MLNKGFLTRILLIFCTIFIASNSFAVLNDNSKDDFSTSEKSLAIKEEATVNEIDKKDKNTNKLNNLHFNTDLLDISDKDNFQIDYFSKPGYIPPGNYYFSISLNNNALKDEKIRFFESLNDPSMTEACLTPEIVKSFGFLKKNQKQLEWVSIPGIKEQCLVVSSVDGMLVQANLPQNSLSIRIPQSYLEYQNSYWVPSSLWSTGINGFILDYNISANWIKQNHTADDNTGNVNTFGLLGYNLGAWRIRAEWQANYRHIVTGYNQKNSDFRWNRFYMYRPIPSLKSQLTVGENYLITDIFDSFRYTGASLVSDINMLPPNLRSYAPEVTGIAQTNALVTISQLGRVIYQSVVPPGPFNIRDLNEGLTGTLNVRVEEQDGRVEEFSVEATSLPFLTRPGQVRYKAAMGRPTNFDHEVTGDLFATGEFSWGVSTNWSLIGGGVLGKDYNSVALGAGRNLHALGAIAFDVTHAMAKLPLGENRSGQSYRINYSKTFNQLGSQIQFAGYRFSERNFLSMNDFLNISENRPYIGQNKEMYRIALNQHFPSKNISLNLNLSKQTFWDGAKDREYYNVSANKIFNFHELKGVTVSVNAYQNRFEEKEWGAFLSLSIPLDNGARAGYSLDTTKNTTSNRVSYSDIVDERTNYQMSYAYDDKDYSSVSAYLNHRSDRARFSVSANHQQDRYSSVAMTMQGGLTVTAEGTDFHRIASMDSTRILVDTEGAENIPLKVYGPTTPSNRFGKAVIGDVNSYYRNQIKVDLNKIPKNAEVNDSIIYSTLTKGSIGYKKLSVISGQKQLLVLKLDTGGYVPFGTQVFNEQGKVAGMVDDQGLTYLFGIHDGKSMTAKLSKNSECVITFNSPNELQANQSIVCKTRNITGDQHD